MEFEKRVVPELRAGLSILEPFRLPEDLMQIRAIHPQAVQQPQAVEIVYLQIHGVHGNELQLRLYKPRSADTRKRPTLLWIHGGGLILGSPEADDQLCIDFVSAADCIVVSPNYRLAPEFPYPAGLEDCYSTLQWISASTEVWGMDCHRIAVGGASAGGGLAAALTLLARDRHGPGIMFQMLLYPMLDHRNVTPSSYEITHPSVWNRANNLEAWRMYLGQELTEGVPIYASPGLATDLTDLPAAYICVGELDLFRDETLDYVTRLARAGVEVEFHLYPGCYHASEHVVPEADISQRIRSEYIQGLVRAYRKPDI
ncbi:alpha/beta hydrolase [Paenibacillus sp. ClWae2A]|uniref:alpha/beta hydrolase n=1 Tax=Paenibacillus sp. ClWae2A TaxID=3057177 RepID=UPI0028F644FA|nr:alpha/beta hydrolase [Paenibacillus sp. ClWae2A]MDT9718910.1 alpha/beta hydrolase [Paenibacillus sp. ClWae2A]